MERYELLKGIGTGNFGVTLLMRNKGYQGCRPLKVHPMGGHKRDNIFFCSSQSVADGAHLAGFPIKLSHFDGVQLKNTTLFLAKILE
ncbi:hypothetical protein ZWY2020_028873 [Hordeum vulgare]|nr:hypothetical protein ZWY2020_028873 [Hordeum vulgare]